MQTLLHEETCQLMMTVVDQLQITCLYVQHNAATLHNASKDYSGMLYTRLQE